MSIPDKADYVIIGAGIHGLRTAYHLAAKLKANTNPFFLDETKIINLIQLS